MSVPIAVTGLTPKSRISSGVIRVPPPIPVMPTMAPMPKPKMMIAGFIQGPRQPLIDFLDLLSQKRGVRQDSNVSAETGQFAAGPPSPAAGEAPGAAVSIRGLGHSYGKLEAIERLDLELPAHGVLGLVGPSDL